MLIWVALQTNLTCASGRLKWNLGPGRWWFSCPQHGARLDPLCRQRDGVLTCACCELEEVASPLQPAAYHLCGGSPAWAACFSVETIVKTPEAWFVLLPNTCCALRLRIQAEPFRLQPAARVDVRATGLRFFCWEYCEGPWDLTCLPVESLLWCAPLFCSWAAGRARQVRCFFWHRLNVISSFSCHCEKKSGGTKISSSSVRNAYLRGKIQTWLLVFLHSMFGKRPEHVMKNDHLTSLLTVNWKNSSSGWEVDLSSANNRGSSVRPDRSVPKMMERRNTRCFTAWAHHRPPFCEVDEHFPDNEHPIRAGGDKWHYCNPAVYACVTTSFLSQRKNKVKQTHEPTQQELVVKSCHEAGFSKTVDVGQFLRTTFQQKIVGHDEPIFDAATQ